jgi:DmsE family decaheme c-type cytochrome
MTMFRPPRDLSMGTSSPPARLPRAARWLLIATAAVFCSATYGGAQDKASAPAPPAAPDNKPATYVGSDTCQGCHEDTFNAFQKNPHHAVEGDKKRFGGNACESCHGPGSKHADSMSAADIRQPAKLRPAEADKLCLACHLNQPTHLGRINSSHAKNQVACVACHSVHANGPNGLVPRKAPDINRLCANCHQDIWASFQKPYKHPVPEGAMSCVDCHNPHGSVLPKSIQTVRANEPGCFKCHGDKAGPFIYEHAPVKVEGCSACHMPHGSSNPRMLTRQNVMLVCLECHSNLPAVGTAKNATLGTVGPAIHDFNSPRFQNCSNCHQKVHGSNVSRDLFK